MTDRHLLAITITILFGIFFISMLGIDMAYQSGWIELKGQ